MDDLAAQLRQALKEQGLTQVKLAEMLNTTQPVISRTLKAAVLNDRSHWPDIIEALGFEVTIKPKQQR